MENNSSPVNENDTTGKKSTWIPMDEWIAKFRLAFTNGKLPEILEVMQTVGYTEEKIDELLTQTTQLESLNQKQAKEYGEQYAETEKFNALRASIDATFRKHRNLTRIVLKDNLKATSILRLYERPKTAYGSWIQLIANFYTQIKNSPEILAQTSQASVTLDAVNDVLAQLETLRALKKSQRKETAEAQAATEERDNAFDELYPKYREFIEYAKILLSDNQSLEALGIVVKR